jgi:hypothetical protein
LSNFAEAIHSFGGILNLGFVGSNAEKENLAIMTGGYWIFIEDDRGPMWKAEFASLDEAKRKAEELSASEGDVVFIYCLNTCREILRFVPPKPAKP